MSIRNMIKDQIPGSYYFSFFCHESGPCDDPSHHQSSPPPVFPDSLALTPHTCHSSHSQLFPVITDYLYHSLPPLCLVALYVYVLVFVVCTPGIHAVYMYPGSCIPVSFPFCFLPCWPFCFLLKYFTCSWTQTSVLQWFLSPLCEIFALSNLLTQSCLHFHTMRQLTSEHTKCKCIITFVWLSVPHTVAYFDAAILSIKTLIYIFCFCCQTAG